MQNQSDFSRRSGGERLALLAVLLCGYAVRLYALARQDIWWDEARNIDVALRPFWQIATAPELDIQPPLYFWLLHLWGRSMGVHVGMDPVIVAFTARTLSVAAGIIGLVLLYQLTRRIGGSTAGLLAALAGAVSPLWLAESQETRMYTLGFALLTGAAVTFLWGIQHWAPEIRHGVWDARRLDRMRSIASIKYRVSRYWYWMLFVLLSALALVTHYNAVFILVAWYLWWGIMAWLGPDRWRRLRTVFLCGLGMILLVLPVMPIALRQIPTYENPNLSVPTLGQYLGENWTGFLGGYAWSGAPIGDWWLWAVLIVVLLGLVWSMAGGSTQRVSEGTGRLVPRTTHLVILSSCHPVTFLLTWFLGGLAFYYVAVLDRGAFNVRYSSFVTPALYALLGIGLAGLGRVQRWLPVAGVALLLVGLAPAVDADLNDPHSFREDTAGLADWLRAETGPGDVIFVDQKYPFGFYYTGYALEPDVESRGPEEAPARYLFVDINTLDQRLNEWAGEAQRIFWVQWFESDTDPRGAVSFLLDKYGERAGSQDFQGYSVRWWQLTPPTTFQLAEDLAPRIHRWRPGVETVETSVPATAAAGEALPVVVRWQRAAGDIDRPLKARVALYNGGGERLVQDDRRILNDRHLAPSEWSAADQPLNVYMLDLPTGLPPARYEVRLLVYDADTLAPVELTDEAGNPAGFEPGIGVVDIGY